MRFKSNITEVSEGNTAVGIIIRKMREMMGKGDKGIAKGDGQGDDRRHSLCLTLLSCLS